MADGRWQCQLALKSVPRPRQIESQPLPASDSQIVSECRVIALQQHFNANMHLFMEENRWSCRQKLVIEHKIIRNAHRRSKMEAGYTGRPARWCRYPRCVALCLKRN